MQFVPSSTFICHLREIDNSSLQNFYRKETIINNELFIYVLFSLAWIMDIDNNIPKPDSRASSSVSRRQ